MNFISWLHALAFIGAGCIFFGLLSFFFAITFAFGKIREIEDAVAVPGRQIDFWRRTGNDPIARHMRALYVFHFLICKRIPRYGPRMAAQLGDETKELPLRLKVWGIIPVGAGLAFVLIAFLLGVIMMAFSD